MTRPHRCPVCNGSGVTLSPAATATNGSDCRACKGDGYLWEPAKPQEAQHQTPLPGQLDLTYDGE